MKKIVLATLLLISTIISAHAQIYIPNGAVQTSSNNNVGIGIAAPSAKLDVYSTTDLGIRFSGIRTHRPGEFGQFAFMDYNVNGDISFFGSSYTGGAGQYGKISFRQYTQGNVYRDAMYIDNSGNIGIGTISPKAKLDVYSDIDLGIRYGGIRTHRPGEFGQFAFMDYNVNGDISFFGSSYTGGAGQYGKISFRQYTQGNVYRDAMYIDNSGNIGIGTISPKAKLDVYSDIDLGIRYGGIRTHRPGEFGQFAFMDYNVSGDISFFGSSYTGSTGQYGKISFRQYTQGDVYRDAMYIDNIGNVGIGTTAPDAKLTVNGNIHAKEVKIDLGFPAPDYVFASDYKLKSLQEVEEYIKKNSHLPEIPSAKEIEKNGLLLSEMNMSLLKKVEELTLYVIEQEKKNTRQSDEIETLKKENESFKTLSERFSKIENQLKTIK